VITQEELKKLLHYDPLTGHFTWLRTGKRAGGAVTKRNCLYRVINIQGKRYYEHILAFLFMNEPQPAFIDHWDLDGLNNSWINLRPSTASQNAANSRLSNKNTSGHKGVYFDNGRGKWVARIMCQRKRFFLGYFSVKKMAVAAYARAAVELFQEFARVS
jgi:hypothetical protein